MLRDVPIKVVLVGGFLLSGVLPLMASATLSRSAARDALVTQAERQLASVRDLKAAELGRFFDGARRDVEVLATDPSTAAALGDLAAVAAAAGGPAALGLRGLTDGRYAAPDAFRAAHDRYAPYLERFATGHGYYDLFLIDAPTGHVLFSVVKEPDFGAAVDATDSALRDAFDASVRLRRAALSDTRPYGPSGGVPAQFVAAPILRDGHLLGVVAVQISIDAIDRIMRERPGLGRSGDAYLVGPDRRLRSDSGRDPSGHTVAASLAGAPTARGVDTPAARAALAGRETVGPGVGFDGRRVLAAAAPVELGGLRWAVVAEIDEAEIDAAIAGALDTGITVTLALSAVLLALLALGVSRVSGASIARVVSALGRLIDRVLDGRGHERLDPDDLPVDFRGVAVKTNELAAALVRQTREKHQLEEVLQYNQRMESIGTLAGGIAHDFNNVLTYLGTHVELAADDLPPASPARGHLDAVVTGIDRASDLIGQIMLFSRQMKRERRPVDVSLIVKEAVKLLKATLPRTIRVEKSIVGEGAWVLADPTQVHQVVMNLCTNAFHAMLRTGGALRVTLAREELPAGPEADGPLAPHAVLAVADEGEGIDPAIVDRVFEPFFTTKPVGQGTGMGLAVVHGIVAAHQGRITIASELGRGTTVTVALPIHAAAARAPDEVHPDAPERGRGTILFVDDEPAIGEAVAGGLASLGYEVEVHAVPEEALAAFAESPTRFDAVVTDLSMPGLDGAELTRRVKALRPDVPVLLTTGYAEKLTPEGAAALGASMLLMKPYRRRDLGRALRAAIRGEG